MKLTTITLLFLCFLPHLVFSQNPFVDSLEYVLNNQSKEDIEKAKLLNILIYEYQYIDLDQMEKYIEINEKLVDKLDYTDGKAGVIYYKAQLAGSRSEHSKARDYYKEAIKLYEILGQKEVFLIA